VSSYPGAVLVDTGVWLGMLDARDPHHASAMRLTEHIDSWRVLMPSPCLYETLSTRFVKDRRRVQAFREILARKNVEMIDDRAYRAIATEAVWSSSDARNISLVDMVIRMIVSDSSIRVTGVVTLNPGDFHDVCRKRRIEMLSTP
jgi:predicted nucleic acid-binding protein